ncbi:hypothetical protein LGL08_02145 [Clostridium estertheticum]|uniref:hypothetical protein n=1 Tax=Clostridium estertheticum TaxID=238834 RepID=UPI001CF0FD7D|nr:hypothetical protein [Clostridium estertheticum]MCB2305276.1 hypothetical protein [Clostridium estertheticum]MCB2343454.1 hypothetical protein [Clostridium estertheticum]MCB2348374.1 hypothetical protein [Clostridium estertheticum]WAG47323.1 hypothetical protein LL127_07685 [Clostridium estertheticum]
MAKQEFLNGNSIASASLLSSHFRKKFILGWCTKDDLIESVKVIFNLSQKNIILEDEDAFKKKILLLKHLYKQI